MSDPLTDTPSLLDLTRALATDDATKAAFQADPEGFLRDRGWGDLDPADLATALDHVADALPVHLAGALFELGGDGLGVVDQLVGVATIDPVDAERSWSELTGDGHDLGLADLDDLDDDLASEREGGLDPAELDDADGGGLDPADQDDGPSAAKAGSDAEDRDTDDGDLAKAGDFGHGGSLDAGEDGADEDEADEDALGIRVLDEAESGGRFALVDDRGDDGDAPVTPDADDGGLGLFDPTDDDDLDGSPPDGDD